MYNEIIEILLDKDKIDKIIKSTSKDRFTNGNIN